MKLKVKSWKLKSEKGSVLLLVTVALTAILGIVGLAMDAGQLYVTYQQAQAAADAAVLAGAMDMYNHTGFAAGAFGGGAIVCVANSAQSPCVYAQLNGFSPPDTVTIQFRACHIPPGVGVLPPVFGGAGSLICATVSRVVPTTFLRVLGIPPSTVTATATAAIIGGNSLTPLLITQPTLSGALALNSGSSILKLCGGPNIGIQINSNSATAVQNGGTVDLSQGGPNDNGTCANGTGSSFRVVGPTPEPDGILLGATGQYSSSVAVVADPLASVNPPGQPGAAPATSTIKVTGVDGCPAAPCTLYSPGTYPAGIMVSNSALFAPGIYYITSGGFQGQTGGCMAMATGFTDPATGWTGQMMVYNTGGGTFGTSGTFGQGCVQNSLVGSPSNSAYEGILFFQDRNSPLLLHNFAGTGSFALNGTIYMNNANPAQYQTLNLAGGPVSVTGEIIAGSLTLNGGTLTMNLAPQQTSAKQVALVQ